MVQADLANLRKGEDRNGPDITPLDCAYSVKHFRSVSNDSKLSLNKLGDEIWDLYTILDRLGLVRLFLRWGCGGVR